MEGTNNERPTVRASALYFVPEKGKAFKGKADVKESPEELLGLSGLEITVNSINPVTLSKEVRQKIEILSSKRLTERAIARRDVRGKGTDRSE